MVTRVRPAAGEPTSSDVAQAAGVSQSTVSRAIRGDSRISAATRQRVREVAQEIGYRQSNAPLAARPTRRRVGIVVSDVTNPFYPELMDALQAELGFLGISDLLFNLRDSSALPGALVEMIDAGEIDGLILTSMSSASRLPRRLLDSSFPTVLLNRRIDTSSLPTVTADNALGGRLAAQHLCELGHRDIAVIAAPSSISTHRDRRLAFIDEARSLGIDQVLEVPQQSDHYSHDTGEYAMQRLLAAAVRPTAVFCTNDLIAYGAMSAIRSAGLRVPEDVSVVGFDDLDMSSWPILNLTTVQSPLRKMAQSACQLLADAIERPTSADGRSVQLPVRLIARGSTAAASSKGSS